MCSHLVTRMQDKISAKELENVTKLKYLGLSVTNKKLH